MRRATELVPLLAGALITTLGPGCAGGGGNRQADAGSSDAGPAYVVHISMQTFEPATLTVPAGSTVTFVNEDSVPHSATSEAATGDYTGGAAGGGFQFDTGTFSGTATVTVPAGLASGTVQPYFCTVHTKHMTDPDPTLVIQ